MDAVMVPPCEFRINRRQTVDPEISTKQNDVERLPTKVHPKSSKKVKKLERGEGLFAGTLRARLISAGIGMEPYPVGVEADVRDVSVRRNFMRDHYGGNQFSAFPAIAEEWYMKTGHRYFMYPNLA
ncbi:hypothetical protein MSAN_01380600 [Mycena sanguinolenta]|uniref:Uncharacterized protein n=1 Tax=Mycena sanguinolenta TaxID=230812 RepID=A0A8H7CXY1_9AGAR|nr:hypothetical protein MSAN_01380600 [Mycena sanguinolenta]